MLSSAAFVPRAPHNSMGGHGQARPPTLSRNKHTETRTFHIASCIDVMQKTVLGGFAAGQFPVHSFCCFDHSLEINFAIKKTCCYLSESPQPIQSTSVVARWPQVFTVCLN